jgi:predicted nucleotidyltransferase
MRLTDQQRQILLAAVQQVLGSDVIVKLFGSRVDDFAKGGDIDLYVRSHHPITQPAYRIAMIQAKLIRALGDRKVDVLLGAPNLESKMIHRIADQTGLLL